MNPLAHGVHTMVRLGGGGWTCDCGTIHASEDQRDVFIHLVWVLQEQNSALWNAGQRACNDAAGWREQLGGVLDQCRPVRLPESET